MCVYLKSSSRVFWVPGIFEAVLVAFHEEFEVVSATKVFRKSFLKEQRFLFCCVIKTKQDV